MPLRSPIFAALAAIYEESQAGRSGRGKLDVQPTWTELEERFRRRQHRALEGDEYDLALTELRALDQGILKLEWDHPRAKTTLHKVRLSPAREADFYAALERESPTQLRGRWSEMFGRAIARPDLEAYPQEWRSFCARRAAQALHWEDMEPFRFRKSLEGEALLRTTALLLNWKGRNQIGWVSSHLCADSKFLARRQKSLELLLRESSGGAIADFASHGILPMPRDVKVAGRLRLRLSGREFDCEAQEICTLSLSDLERAELVSCGAPRCLTVENKTVFHDLAGKRSGELILWTSFPNAATLALLALLPPGLEFWHFGDTDPSGFHILDDLCRRSGRVFRPFRMKVRPRAQARLLTAVQQSLLRRLALSPRMTESHTEIATLLADGTVGAYEQEEHQPAPLDHWPFY